MGVDDLKLAEGLDQVWFRILRSPRYRNANAKIFASDSDNNFFDIHNVIQSITILIFAQCQLLKVFAAS